MDKRFKALAKAVDKATKIYLNKDFVEREDKHKFENDDVTNRDIEVQEYIKSVFLKLFPNSDFIGEEGSSKKSGEGSGFSLIVDPIDGTFNYKHSIPCFDTQLCLLKDGYPVFSCLKLDCERFYATEEGAFLGESKIHVSAPTALENTVVNVGDFQQKGLKIQQKIMGILSGKVKRIRMFGSSCFDSCMLARGSTDVYIIFTNALWDLMPGQYLIKQAGGSFYTNPSRSIGIFGNKANVEKIVEVLKGIEEFNQEF